MGAAAHNLSQIPALFRLVQCLPLVYATRWPPRRSLKYKSVAKIQRIREADPMRANKFSNTGTLQTACPVLSREKSNSIDFIVGLIFIIAVCVLNRASVVHGAIGSDAVTTVRGTVSQVLNILNDHQSSQQERRRRLIAVVAGHFDFADMARSSLGYHWRQLTPDQQQRFVQLFTTLRSTTSVLRPTTATSSTG